MARTQPLLPKGMRQPLPEPPDEPRVVVLGALPLTTVMRVERMAGSRLSAIDSDAKLLAAIVAVTYGADLGLVSEESLDSLSRYVTLAGPDDEGDGEDDGQGNG